MPRFKLTIAYDGTAFHGWQKQEPPDSEPLRTVQGVVEQAVRDTVRQPVELLGASRTDAGVHALGQVAAFSAQTNISIEKLPRAISARLPNDVQIRAAEIVADDFDPIKDCVKKMYRFSIAHGGENERRENEKRENEGGPEEVSSFIHHPPPLFDRNFVYYIYHSLDSVAMHEAARRLVGTHDFASFAQISHGRESTVRTIFDCSVAATSDDRCHIDVTGDGFLYNMVRIIAGTLVEVGRGKWPAERVREILESRDRRAAGPTLPPNGLCLQWIEY